MPTPVSRSMAASQIQSSYRNYRRNKAATCIQSFYRGHIVRKFRDWVGKDWSCSVCLEGYTHSDVISKLGRSPTIVKTLCKHTFHKTCVERVVPKPRGRHCPICCTVIKTREEMDELFGETWWQSRNLEYAIYDGELEKVMDLIRAGVVDVNSTDQWGISYLHNACERPRFEIVTALIEAGADMNAVNGMGNTPLHSAVESGTVGNVKFLISAGANRCIKNHLGHTPFDLAIRKGNLRSAW